MLDVSEKPRGKFSKSGNSLQGEEARRGTGFAGNPEQPDTLRGTEDTDGEAGGRRAEVCTPSTLGGSRSLRAHAAVGSPHLSVEQVGGGLHDVHQNSHWTPAKLVPQRIV